MNAMQSDVGRQTKVVAIGAGVAIVAAFYVIYSYAAQGDTRPSSVGSMQRGQPTPVAESEYYRDVLAKYNQQHAAAATQTGETYVSVFSARPLAVAPLPATPEPKPDNGAEADPAFNQQSGQAVVNVAPSPVQPSTQAPMLNTQRQQEQLTQQAEALMNNWAAAGHGAARVSEIDYAQLPAATTARPTNQATQGQSALVNRSGAGDTSPIVPALSILPAVLATDIDTDENSIVEVAIPAGKYAGAVVIAMGYKLAGNGVDMTFTLMKWRGNSYRIHAKPVDQDSMRSTLSGEVNNRYISRILWPAIATGLGRTGYLFEQAGTQSVVTPLGGVVQTHPDSPSSRSIAGTIIGGAATETGQVMRQDAAMQPVRQVLIARNLTLGVRFLEPVFASDELSDRTRQGERPAPAPADLNETVQAQDPALSLAAGRRP